MLVYISTDDSSFVDAAEFDSVAEALDAFDTPSYVRDEDSFCDWLERVGGYGYIEVDGEVVAEVKS